MSRSISFSLWGVIIALPALFIGCSVEQQSEPAATATATTPAQSPVGETSEGGEEQAEIKEALAKLSPEDRALAEKQKTCPVTDEPLGFMGTPLKVTVDGKSFFICCEGCREDAEKNFSEHLAKLDSPAAMQ
jgi:hypothetical protein